MEELDISKIASQFGKLSWESRKKHKAEAFEHLRRIACLRGKAKPQNILHNHERVEELEGIDSLRKKVRIRDNHICQKCGKKWQKGQRRFDVHHLDEDKEGRRERKGAYAIDQMNLDGMITFCYKCQLNLARAAKGY